MHVDHAWIPLQRIIRARLDADDIARIAPRSAKHHEVVSQEGGLFGAEETACDDIAVLVEA